MIDIKKTLEKLNISKENMGASTGNNFFGSCGFFFQQPHHDRYQGNTKNGQAVGQIPESGTSHGYSRAVMGR